MKILYAVQGTGNGHISRARELVKAIATRAKVDVLVSGMHAELEFDYPVRFRLNGLGFKFGKNGGIDYFNTWRQGNIRQFIHESESLDLRDYDLVINDFEPVSAWAARRQHVPCVGLSNQCILLDKRIERPNKKKYRFAKMVLKHYAPIDIAYGMYYEVFGQFATTPVIRKEIRQLKTSDKGHYLVYLPFFTDKKILKALTKFEGNRFMVFSKHSSRAYFKGNTAVMPICSGRFVSALASARGVICGAGFATTSEVLFLGKKLLVIPMKNQFEQQCNALALKKYGVKSIKSLNKKWHAEIKSFLNSGQAFQMSYPDNSQQIIDRIISDFANQNAVLHEGLCNLKLSPSI